jgi:hypothetical protein
MKRTIKRISPEPLWNAARNTYDAVMRLPEVPAAIFHPWRRASRQRLAAMKNNYKGQRCFIIGNGPSLNKTDLSKLRQEYTFGLNRIYLLFPKLGFTTSFYLSMNDLVIEQCADDIVRLPVPKFLSWRSHRFLNPTQDTHFLYTTYTGPKFARDVTGRLWEGATVTYVALQLAYHLGFETAVLIGVDHNFVTRGDANKVVTSQGDDPNHFAPDYFGKGFKWQLPDLETSERAYRMARQAYEADGRRVLDATVGGKLTVFPKVDYAGLF